MPERTLRGFVIAVLITLANIDDGDAAVALFEKVDPVKYPRLRIIWSDNKYHNLALEAWLQKHRPGWTLEVQSPPKGSKEFVVVPKRWVVERSFAWMGRNRRLSNVLVATNFSTPSARSEANNFISSRWLLGLRSSQVL